MKELRLSVEELEQRVAPLLVDWAPPVGILEGTFDTVNRDGFINFINGRNDIDLGGPDT